MSTDTDQRKNYQKIMVGFIIVTLFLTFFSKSFYNYSLPVVTVASPKQGALDFSVEGTATVNYTDVRTYYAQKDGIIHDIFIEKGDRVKKGQRVMQMILPDTDKTEDITAKEDGIITAVGVEEGMFVSYMQNIALYGAAIISEEWSVILNISDAEAENIEEGDKATVKLPNQNLSLEGKVVEVSSYQNEAFAGWQVDIRFVSKEPSIAWKRADVTIKKNSAMYGTLIPVDALRKDAKGYYVLVPQEDDSILGDGYIAQRISVDLLDSDKSYCAVEGLPEGEAVIVATTKEIAGGDHIYYEGRE